MGKKRRFLQCRSMIRGLTRKSRQQSKMEQEIGNLRLLNLLLLIAMLEAKNQPKENAIAIFSFCSCV